jgi:hypothetical protein
MPISIMNNIQIEIKEIKATVNINIIAANDYTIIIRTDWLTKVKAKIEFDPLQLTIQQNGITVTVLYIQWQQKKEVISIIKEEESSDNDFESEFKEEEAYTYVTFTREVKEKSQVIFNKQRIKFGEKLHN